ncbi:hypothetical protein NDU88_003413 [Pleurodeles waltl]|uniref:Uncharacterized protein n=1 Tax=Pleurodeles waltl TaxID=8319 RepID=A0AAV7T578_PLEWA|nr:hypothetical protein NDU88_003413 [Pleurodeles waltl]
MGDCSTPQPKRMGGHAAHPTADRVLEDEEPLPDQAAAQARQVRLEGRDSIVRFLCRTATGIPEWGREYVRLHATEEKVDSQTSTEEQILMAGTHQIHPQKQTFLAHRSLSCPALTTDHHD